MDRIYIQEHLITHVINTDIDPDYRSDHSIVSLNVREPRKKRGPGIWKFNEYLLKDKNYDEMVKLLFFDVVKQYAIPIYSDDFMSNPKSFETIQFKIDIGVFYETLLMMIRGETIRFSKQEARKRRAKERETTNEISRLKDTFNTNKTQDDLMHLEEAQSKLENIRKPNIQGLITMSRAKWYEDEENVPNR